MKSLLALCVAAALALLVGGCTTPSLNPLATPETVVTDQDLVGTWIDPESMDETYVVTTSGKDAYELKCIPKDTSKRTLEFSFQICRLADTRFIDLTVTKASGDELNDKYGSVVVPAHVFMKMRRERDQLTVWMIKDEWLKDGLKSGEVKLAHATLKEPGDDKESYVLSGSTSELQLFFRNNVDNEELFDKATVFERDTPEKPVQPKKKPAAK
jgi:hypothetical protein